MKWTNLLKAHIGKYPLLYKLNHIRNNLWFALHLPRIHGDDTFMQRWPKFTEDLHNRTEDVLTCAGLAAHQKITEDLPPLSQTEDSMIEGGSHKSLVTIRARLHGHTPVSDLRTLKQSSYGKLVSVRGTVIRVNAPQIVCSWMTFQCSKCKSTQALKSTTGYRIVQPTSCKNRGCNARGNFHTVLPSIYTRSESNQMIRLQASMQHSHSASGEVPKTIDVELTFDLVDTVCPGDDVTITGIMQITVPDAGPGHNQNESMHSYYLQAVSLNNNKNSLAARNSDFSEADLRIINQIKNGPDPLRSFVLSLCPNIFGHEMVKTGLVLALFGGSGGKTSSENAPGTGRRAEPHVLVVGDPGVGKSHLLQACANVAPRGSVLEWKVGLGSILPLFMIAGVFVCGNSTTNAGLTVTVRHEKGVGGSLEAGALVLADQGVCCIDEFDKMSSNYQVMSSSVSKIESGHCQTQLNLFHPFQSLLQVMEQQIVSVAKAGVLCSLPARTSILAVANPAGGHYDKSKTVSENLRLNPALLSRFDLVFILLDKADAHLDDLLTAHIQALHSNRRYSQTNPSTSATQMSSQPSASFLRTQQRGADEPRVALYERLRINDNTQFNPIPHEVMQKYIGYARKNCFPVLSDAATIELKAFYLELRKTRPGVDSIPATTRQLEALIRLTQARARLDLCPEATVEHARDVLSIIRYSMVDVMSSDDNTLNMTRSINGIGMSQATQARKFLQALQCQNKNVISYDELKAIATTIGVQANVTNLIDALNVQGFLIKKGNNIYKFIN